MKTISFIGSDKNAGKTTVLNFVYKRLRKQLKLKSAICLTSIGINGEETDRYEGSGPKKPAIKVFAGDYLITRECHLRATTAAAASYSIVYDFSQGTESDPLLLVRVNATLGGVAVLLEGPNDKSELMRAKEYLLAQRDIAYFLLDGSIDRQFLAAPEVSDSFYFALLLSDRAPQLSKAYDLVHAVSLNMAEEGDYRVVADCQYSSSAEIKSILYDDHNEVIYMGKEIAFLDKQLFKHLEEIDNISNSSLPFYHQIGVNSGLSHTPLQYYLYLNSALTPTIMKRIGKIKNLNLILDNFTLIQNISSVINLSGSQAQNQMSANLPPIALLHQVKVDGFFWRSEGGSKNKSKETLLRKILGSIKDIPVHNLYRENPHEIRVRP
ncbi:MAG: hypothetical protein HQK50_03275 [Oligoflexia bacterium]|nr:hypothetical protein [Oligoflexia bacterium]MBF0364564.1 hypothetical protein [Oligoflexia bacterium]